MTIYTRNQIKITVVIALMKVKLLTNISGNLSYNTKNALVKGTIVGIITAIIYLAVVVITTPNLPPSISISAAFKVNGIIIIGLAIGVGIQVFISTYSKGLGCRLDERKSKYKQQNKDIWRIFRISKRTGSSGSGGGTVISSFLSFFSLVPLGCCGSWLFILSMLPSVFGGTVSVILIEYSILLSYVGLIIVLGFASVSILRLRKELIERRLLSERTNSNYNNDDENKTIKTSTLESKLQGRGMYDIEF
jgi:hypothetical protein